MRALTPYYTMTREGVHDAHALLRSAIQDDPDYSFAKAFVAALCVIKKSQDWASVSDVEEAIRLAHEALIANHDDAVAIAMAGHALAHLNHEYDLATAALNRALLLNPGSAPVLARSAWVRTWASDALAAIDQFERAIRLSPLDNELGYHFSGLAYAHLIAGNFGEALQAARRSVSEMPRWSSGWRALAIVLVRLGRLPEATSAAAQILAITPSITTHRLRALLAFKDAGVREGFLRDLRAAGLPE
jgi:adenylate cyclase